MTSTPSSEWSPELRRTRIASPNTLFISTAVLTQMMVLSAVAVIMGFAVLTMSALLIELLVLTAIATALERRFVSLEDLGTLMEVAATLLITILTILLAAMGGNRTDVTPPLPDQGITLAALRYT